MEIEYSLLLIATALVLAFVLNFVQKKRDSSKHLGDSVFIWLSIISIVGLFSSIFIGQWTGIAIAAISVYLLIFAISGFIFTKFLKMFNSANGSTNKM